MNRKTAAHPAGKAGSGSAGSENIHNITDARTGQTDDMHRRMVKYALAMGIRLVCLLLIFVLDGWLKLIAVAGAVFLPWIAVVIANGGSDTVNEHSAALLDSAPLAELESLPYPAPADSGGNGSSGNDSDGRDGYAHSPTVRGEVVDDDDDLAGTGGRTAHNGGRPDDEADGGRTMHNDGGRQPGNDDGQP
ncbi:DUF3099 domain-containing protein [Paenarthrobacter sp. Z7-10]|uniref:DUF3099 domain-containing protein n=1 Tax=Paenarthrobacter sp. Z7-10 TaxID=2787635 RepID=UPI002E79EC97|nr:DUF3099 domain-containing protein [Paenarthrobacter sp. Z7-10]MCZ2402644.1 DUF3099 domain-containing protein [Paenarthrobacter sp. Z7-10]